MTVQTTGETLNRSDSNHGDDKVAQKRLYGSPRLQVVDLLVRQAALVGAVRDAEAVAGAPRLLVGEVVNELHLLHQVACDSMDRGSGGSITAWGMAGSADRLNIRVSQRLAARVWLRHRRQAEGDAPHSACHVIHGVTE